MLSLASQLESLGWAVYSHAPGAIPCWRNKNVVLPPGFNMRILDLGDELLFELEGSSGQEQHSVCLSACCNNVQDPKHISMVVDKLIAAVNAFLSSSNS